MVVRRSKYPIPIVAAAVCCWLLGPWSQQRETERERQVCAGVTISQPTPPPATTLPPLVKADFKHGRGERREAVGSAISMFNVTPRNRTESAWTIPLRSEKLVWVVKLNWSKAYKHFSQPWAISYGQSANVIVFPRWIHWVYGDFATLMLHLSYYL